MSKFGPAIQKLQPYPFQRLNTLLADTAPRTNDLAPISLTIGEPQHPLPDLIRDALIEAASGFGRYPTTIGESTLRQACADWVERRYGVKLDPERAVLPVAGTREALFAIAQLVRARLPHDSRRHRVLIPNPFYQIYEGAALLAGLTPTFYPLDAENGFRPNIDAIPNNIWAETALIYVCNPGNPAGACMSRTEIGHLVERAREYEVLVAADECYAEIFPQHQPSTEKTASATTSATQSAVSPPGETETKPTGSSSSPAGPTGFLQAGRALDDERDASQAPSPLSNIEIRPDTANDDPHRGVIVFHSLSKRSNAPGLRSGFVAGDAAWLADFLRYRTYHGCTLPLPIQVASAAAWRDDPHVAENRRLYDEKFNHALNALAPHLPVSRPDAGFYLWPRLPHNLHEGDDAAFTRALWEQTGVKVLPGRYLSRRVIHVGERSARDPALGHLRLALVADVETCRTAVERIATFIAQGAS